MSNENPTPQEGAGQWEFPQADLARLRLLLHRRTLWLRSCWQGDPLREYPEPVISDWQADWLLHQADRRGEWDFYERDAEAALLTKQVRHHADLLQQRDEALLSAGAPNRMQSLASKFGLTPFDQEVLLLGLAPEVEPAFGRLYAYVQDDVHRRLPTPELALALFAWDDTSWLGARSRFLPQAPLRHYALIALEATSPQPHAAVPFRLDDRIADFLLGVNRPDERAGAWLREVRAEPLVTTAYPAAPAAAVAMVREAIGQRDSRLPILNIVGAAGAGRRAVARAACDQFGLRLYEIDLEAFPSGAERGPALRLVEREAPLQPAAFYVQAPAAGAGPGAPDPHFVIEHMGGLMFVGSDRPWSSPIGRVSRAIWTITLPESNTAAQRRMWEQALAEAQISLDGHLDQVVEQFQFQPAQIRRAAEAVAARRSASASFGPADVWQACREQAGGGLDELAQRINPCYVWDDIVVPDDVFRQLREVADQVAHRAKVYEDWGFGAKLSRGRGISAMFSGPSGVGKTMAAEVLANQLRLDLYRIDLSSVVSKYIGETEKNLRRVFDAAEGGGAILFFDEADALFGKRSEVRDSHDRYANIEVNYLLQRMEDYRGLAILATNMRSAIDTAFMRRLRFVVELPFPDAGLRERIWRGVFPPQAALGALDFALLARWEIAGGNIRNIALNAAFQAAGEGAPIQMAHLVRAARREYAKIHKLVREGEFGSFAADVAR